MTDNRIDALNSVVSRLVGREANPLTLLGMPSPLIDTSRANLHESKKEFLIEKAAVKTVVEGLKSVVELVISSEEKDTPERKAMMQRLQVAIEIKALQQVRHNSVDTAMDLAIKNIFETGFYFGSMRLIVAMYLFFNERLSELNEQEAQFWTVASRPPNYYARTIALRLARFYARETGKRPTFGMSREGNFPSTDFGRALEEVFRILEIKASVRNAATWALNQLSDDDLRPSRNALADYLGLPESGSSSLLSVLSGR